MAGVQIDKLEWGVDKPCTRTELSWDKIASYKWPLTAAEPELRDAAPDKASSSRDAGKEPARTAGTTHSPPQPHKLSSSHGLYVVQGDLKGYENTLSSAFDVDIEFFEAHKSRKQYHWRAGVDKKAKPPSVTVTYLIPQYLVLHAPGLQQAQYSRASIWESAHISFLLLDDTPISFTQYALMDIINSTVQQNAASVAIGMVPATVAQLAHRECLLYLDALATDTDVHLDYGRYKDIAWALEHNLVASQLQKVIRRTRRGIYQEGLEHGGVGAPLVGPLPEYESLDTVGTDDWEKLIARLDRMVRLTALYQADKMAVSDTRIKSSQDRISYMGGFLLPLTIVAGIFSMADPYRPGSNLFWLYWAISIPVVCLCLTIIHADDIRNVEYYLPMNDIRDRAYDIRYREMYLPINDERYEAAVKVNKALDLNVAPPAEEAVSADVALPAANQADRQRHHIKSWHDLMPTIPMPFIPTRRRSAAPSTRIQPDDSSPDSSPEASQPVDVPVAPTRPVDRLTPPPVHRRATAVEPVAIDAPIPSVQRRRRRLSLNPVGWLFPFERPAAASGPEVDEDGDHQPVTPSIKRRATGRSINTPGYPPMVLQKDAGGLDRYYRREKLGWGGALKVMLGFETLPQA